MLTIALIFLAAWIALIVKFKLNTRSRASKEAWKTRKSTRTVAKIEKPIWVSDLARLA